MEAQVYEDIPDMQIREINSSFEILRAWMNIMMNKVLVIMYANFDMLTMNIL